MPDPLHNPVYTALRTRDAHLGTAAGEVAWFDAAVSPFAGFPDGYEAGFDELHRWLPERSRILFARPEPVERFPGWRVAAGIEGAQFVYQGGPPPTEEDDRLVRLGAEQVPEMMALAGLTKPGPFGERTIEFGQYYGLIEGGELVAMTGQRLHLPGYSEISAVCTHPDHLGKGYAAALIRKQLQLICGAGDTPFLHVRADNSRAIEVYERLGFVKSRPMHFYFLARQ